MAHVVDREFAGAILSVANSGHVVETVVNVQVGHSDEYASNYHRIWVQPLNLSKGFNVYPTILPFKVSFYSTQIRMYSCC